MGIKDNSAFEGKHKIGSKKVGWYFTRGARTAHSAATGPFPASRNAYKAARNEIL